MQVETKHLLVLGLIFLLSSVVFAANIIQIRRDTAANWTSADPTLAQGEMGFETDTLRLKFGDGSTAWISLAYYSTDGVGGVGRTYTSGTPATLQVNNDLNTISMDFDGNFNARTQGSADFNSIYLNSGVGDVLWSELDVIIPWVDANISSADIWNAKLDWNELNVVIPWQDVNVADDITVSNYVRNDIFNASFPVDWDTNISNRPYIVIESDIDANVFDILQNQVPWQDANVADDITVSNYVTNIVFNASWPVDDNNINFGTGVNQVNIADLPIALNGGSPTVDQMQEYLDSTGSSGFFSGGIITDGGSGTIDITSGEGMIRATDSDIAPILVFTWSAVTGLAIDVNSTRFIYVEYNTGSPQVVLSSSEFDEDNTKIQIGVASNEDGVIHPFNLGVRLEESIGQAGRFIRRVISISRDVRKGGLIFGETGTRNITLSSGVLWWGRTEYPITAVDTSSSGSFNIYYRDASTGFLKTASATQWDNLNWDDGTGTLNTLGNNKWGTLWLFIEPDDEFAMVYGREEHNTLASAELESVPNTLPPHLTDTSVLAGRIVFQQNAATGSFSSSFEVVFTNIGVTSHTDLSTLAWTSALHTGTAFTLAGFDGTGVATEYTESNYVLIDGSRIFDLNKLSDVDTTGFKNKSRLCWSNANAQWESCDPEAETVKFIAEAGEILGDSDVVHISGQTNGIPIVSLADASDPSKMPAIGIVISGGNQFDDVEVAAFGNLNTTDTSSWSIGEDLYVAVGGGLTNVKPTGTALIQKLAEVQSVGVLGHIFIFGAGRTNDIPNLLSANFWLGDGSGVPQAVDFNSNWLGNLTGKNISLLNNDSDFTTNSALFAATQNIADGNIVDVPAASILAGTFGGSTKYTFPQNLQVTGDLGINVATAGAPLDVQMPSAASVQVAHFEATGMSDGQRVFLSLGTAESSNNAFIFLYEHNSVNENRILSIQPWEGGIGVSGLTIAANGNIGMGIKLPIAELHISAATDPTIRISDAGNPSAAAEFKVANNDNLIIGADIGDSGAGSFMAFEVDGLEKMRINTGDVNIASGNLNLGKLLISEDDGNVTITIDGTVVEIIG